MRKDISIHFGKKFGRLTILKQDGFFFERNGHKRPMVLCDCDCGKQKRILLKHILDGRIQSCTCYMKERTSSRTSTHKMSNSTEYRIYVGMLNRCYRKNVAAYKYYGGRGIFVCDRWRESFENFYEDMGPRPSIKLTLDRINNNGGYCKENCRWATQEQQVNNKRLPKTQTLFTYNNRTMNLKDWARHFNINYVTLHSRIKQSKMTFEKAITYTRK